MTHLIPLSLEKKSKKSFSQGKVRKLKQQNTISQCFGDLRLSSTIAIKQHWYFKLNPALRPIQINGILLPKFFSPTVRRNGFY